MQAGRLRHELGLQRQTPVDDGYGGFSEDDGWSTTATVFGRIEPVRGVEREEAHKIESTVTHKVTIRGDGDINAIDRVQFGSRLFRVHYVLDRDERGIEKVMMCTELT